MTLVLQSGRSPVLTAPKHADIALEDIALGLSRICRWNGQLREFYSVAQHSVLVAEQCGAGAGLWGLLHDASEAYLCDLPSPLKALPALAGYRALEAIWQRVIYQRFGLAGEVPREVWTADAYVLAWERRDLVDGAPTAPELPAERLRGLRPRQAEDLFLSRFRELAGAVEDVA